MSGASVGTGAGPEGDLRLIGSDSGSDSGGDSGGDSRCAHNESTPMVILSEKVVM